MYSLIWHYSYMFYGYYLQVQFLSVQTFLNKEKENVCSLKRSELAATERHWP